MLSDEYPELGVRRVADVDRRHARSPCTSRCPTSTPSTRGSSPPAAGVGRPPHDEAYGARSFAMVDPFGHRWMIQTPIATPTIGGDRGRHGGLHDHRPADRRRRPAAARRRARLLHVRRAGHGRGGRFYGALFGWATEAGSAGDEYAHVANTKLPLGLTPGPADEAAGAVLPGRRHRRATRRGSRELGGEVVSETTYDSGPERRVPRRPGPRFQLWQPAPGYE